MFFCFNDSGQFSSWWFFTNPFEKYYIVNLDHFARDRGENKKSLKPPSSFLGRGRGRCFFPRRIHKTNKIAMFGTKHRKKRTHGSFFGGDLFFGKKLILWDLEIT